MNGPLMFLAIEVATVVCALLLAGRVVASRPRLRTAQLTALIAVNTACAVVLAHQEYGAWAPAAFGIEVGGWAGVLNLARNTTAGLIMLLCFSLFTDRRRFPRWLLAMFALQVGLEVATWTVWPRLAPLPALMQTLFAAIAVYWTVADWRADLVESRRRARAVTLVVIGLVTLVSGLLTRVVIAPESPANYAVHIGLTGAYLAILASVLFQLTSGDVGARLDFDATPARRKPPGVAPPDPALARLVALLETERVWEEEGLSLRGLAAKVGLPEYRLRRLIHEELGHRNFNALLHEHRIAEACRQLSDPALARTPILTIALSVGYASVNTFNRGFREILGVAPSEWRAAALAAK
ncbi:helix-turn-helix transcriptional regulator [Phenylobacterium sp. 20VBR1]|uniref:Helix-turn-helix transcriptional regulator n=1 Tax=Phenylobacterium glaciei TaxID=2803784 RepID=A0A941HWF9_9CAUL|nr:helix-turn-helix transcriptional regulator [Phenylobacterium glaciei]